MAQCRVAIACKQQMECPYIFHIEQYVSRRASANLNGNKTNLQQHKILSTAQEIKREECNI